MLHILLADGFEEIEALATFDILQRLHLPVQTVSIKGARQVCGAHGLTMKADSLIRKNELRQSQGIILPGGMPGAANLNSNEAVKKILLHHHVQHTPMAAICAAPMVLGSAGILEGRRATCYPGFEDHLKGATIINEAVVRDNNIITAIGPAATFDFAFAIAAMFLPKDVIEAEKKAMQFP